MSVIVLILELGIITIKMATSTVIPKSSFVRSRRLRRVEPNPQWSPDMSWRPALCLITGLSSKEWSISLYFVNEIWQNYCLGCYMNTDFIPLKQLKSHQKTLNLSYNYIRYDAFRNTIYHFNLKTEKRWKWKYTVTCYNMILQFAEFVFPKQTFIVILK